MSVQSLHQYVLLMSDYFKTIFLVKIYKLCHGEELCVLGDLHNDLLSFFPSITKKKPFQDHLLGKTIVLTQRALSHEAPKQQMFRAESSPLSK